MELITLLFLTGIGGAVVGVIVGTLLGWKRVIEMLEESQELRFKNAELEQELAALKKKNNTEEPVVIEITTPIDPQNIPMFGE